MQVALFGQSVANSDMDGSIRGEDIDELGGYLPQVQGSAVQWIFRVST